MRNEELGLMDKIGDGYNNMWKLLIQPNRMEYYAEYLGPNSQVINGVVYLRHDYAVINSRNQKLCCSFFGISDPQAHGQPSKGKHSTSCSFLIDNSYGSGNNSNTRDLSSE
jgi:hypothetical protein